jgi:hypothetical protein
MANPPFYIGVGDYLNVIVDIDASGHRILSMNLLQVNGVYPNLPGPIFIYTNTGTTTLGDYQGVCGINELARLQIYNSNTAIPIFGNAYVRHNTAKIVIGLTDDHTIIVNQTVANLKALSTAFKSKKNIANIVYIP